MQMIVAEWMKRYDVDEHIEKIRKIYRRKLNLMCDMIDSELGDAVSYVRPEGGLFAWVVLPEYMDAKELQMKCLEKKVAFVPGGSFFPNGGHENTLRLNYSCMPEDKIVKGITALCQTIRENLR